MTTKQPRERTILTFPATKGKWEIYVTVVAVPTKKNKTIIMEQYGTRLISRNGKIICGNTGFNSVRNAIKNTKTVRASA